MRNMFSGKKTYIVAILSILVSGAYGSGYIDETQYKLACSVLAALGLAALRAGVTKAADDAVLPPIQKNVSYSPVSLSSSIPPRRPPEAP